MDVALALLALGFLGPFLLLLALCIRIADGRPIFFRQTRVTRFGKVFRIWKFRTMTVGASSGSSLTVGEDPRVTPLGSLLRRHKLDELPQLLNIVAGDMAWVGPRPEVPRFVDPATSTWQEILRVRPGLVDLTSLLHFDEQTSLAGHDNPEAYYRNVLLPSKLATSLDYEKHRTFLSDIRLLFYTAYRCLPGTHISKEHVEGAFLREKTV